MFAILKRKVTNILVDRSFRLPEFKRIASEFYDSQVK